MDKPTRKGKAKGQKGQETSDSATGNEPCDEPPFLETANDEASLSDKMDETGADSETETGDTAASEETHQ